jgi:hypothetical protein
VEGKADEIVLKLDGPGLKSKHIVVEEDNMEATQPFPTQPPHKHALNGVLGAGFGSKCE